jgi:hypothetical protein
MELSLIDSEIEGIKIFLPPPPDLNLLEAPESTLRKCGIPPRPVAHVSEMKTHRWLKEAKTARVIPKLVKTEYIHGPNQRSRSQANDDSRSWNWCGYVAYDPTNPFQGDAREGAIFYLYSSSRIIWSARHFVA